MSELDELPRELGDLFAAERVASAAPPSARAAVRAKLAASVGAAPLGAGAAAAALGTTGKVLATVALVAGIGGGTFAVVRSLGRRTARPVPAPLVAAASPLPSPAIAPDAPPPAAPASVAAPDPPPPVVAAPRPVPSRRSVERTEPALLREAWQALSAEEPARALRLVERDARVHGEGSLAEEREALRVLALAGLHRDAEARTAATQFFDKYPGSVYRERLDRAIAKTQEAP